jgi:phage baseplate assembly protein W
MPVGAQKIFPIDRRPSIAVGVSIPFNAPGVFNFTFTTQDAVRNNLINFFLTNQNERYLNPTFGGNLRATIFEQLSNENLEGLEDLIQTQLKNYFPSVRVQNLELLSNPDINSLTVDLKYNVIDTGIEDEIQLQFN